MIRPERFLPAGDELRGRNRFRGTVSEIVYVGASQKYRLRLDGGPEILLRLPAGMTVKFPAIHEPFAVDLAPQDVHLLRLG